MFNIKTGQGTCFNNIRKKRKSETIRGLKYAQMAGWTGHLTARGISGK